MRIETERLLLRPLDMGDLETTHAYAGNEENGRYMMYLPNKTMEETKNFLQWAAAEWEKEEQSAYEFAILLDGKHIGVVSAHLDAESGDAELGWILHKAYWGKGYATEAARAVKHFALEELGARRLVAYCDSENIASQRLMDRLGLRLSSRDGTRTYPDARGGSGEYTYIYIVD